MNDINDFLTHYEKVGEELPIFTYPAKVLKKVAVDVDDFNEELFILCKNMLYTMYEAPGIGLAAPQIGKSLRVFVLDTTFQKEEITLPDNTVEFTLKNFAPQIFINPIITNQSGEVTIEEGCLSLPEVYENVKRFQKVTVDYQNLNGEKCTLMAEDLEAVCIQHEVDHLDGIVFLDRLSLFKKNFIIKKIFKKKAL